MMTFELSAHLMTVLYNQCLLRSSHPSKLSETKVNFLSHAHDRQGQHVSIWQSSSVVNSGDRTFTGSRGEKGNIET